jgi:hypothetical protein
MESEGSEKRPILERQVRMLLPDQFPDAAIFQNAYRKEHAELLVQNENGELSVGRSRPSPALSGIRTCPGTYPERSDAGDIGLGI